MPIRKLRFVLLGQGGELANLAFEVRQSDLDEGGDVISNALTRTLKDWTLAVGDTIKIEDA